MTIADAATPGGNPTKRPGRATRRQRNAVGRAVVTRLDAIANLIEAIEFIRPLEKGEAAKIVREALMRPAGGVRIEGRVTIKKGGDDECAS